MDIITALAALPAAQPEASADTGAADGDAFAALLQQAETAVSEIAAPALPTTESLVPVTENAPQFVEEPPQPPAPQPEMPDIPQPAVVETVEIELPEVELPEVEPDPLPAESLALDDAIPSDDDSEQPEDSLAAIRQRLDLIDSASQLSFGAFAAAPQVVAMQPAVANPAPAAENSRTEVLQWTPAEADDIAPAVVESAAQVERPARSTASIGVDSQPDDAPQTMPPPAFAVSSQAPASLVAVASEEIATPMDSPQWQDDLGQQVVAMVRRGDQQVDMRLNPADLGPLSISLNISEGGVQAQFQSAHASVRAAVEQALPQLQATLAAQGLALGEASVSDGASRQTAGEQPRRESQRGEPRREVLESAVAPLPAQPIASSGAVVDLYL